MNESYSELTFAIRKYFSDNWNTVDAPIIWENTPEQPPVSGPWIKFALRFSTLSNETLGTSGISRRGWVHLQLFDQYDTGTGALEVIADKLQALFEYKRTGVIHFGTTELINVGDAVRQLNHIEPIFQMVLKVPFETL